MESGAKRAEDALDDVKRKAGETESATDRVGKKMRETGDAASTTAPKVRTVGAEMGTLGGQADKAGQALGATVPKTKAAGVEIASLTSLATKAGAALGAAAASFATFQAASAAMTQARGFAAAMAETSTLIEGTAEEMAELEASARSMAREFGGEAQAQVKAFYQAISAGAGSVTEASQLLDTANRLAIGGVTDVTTAVDILTTATNVYANEGLTAAEASDALFVAMRAGKTTITELSSSLGAVLPLANNLGVSFDETAAAVAALTKGGISTAESVTGLRAAMTSILAPSKQASDLAAELGIDFSAAGLEARGFSGFMADVVDKTGGSSEAMQQLFSSVEATTVALAMSGSAGQFLVEILGGMEEKTGATSQAFDKLAAGVDQRWNRAIALARDLSLAAGNALLMVAVPALETAAGAVSLIADNADILGASLGLIAAVRLPAMVGAAYSLVTGLGAAAAASGALAVAMNAIPLVAVATGATMVYRAFRDSRQAASDLGATIGRLTEAQDGLNDATTRFYDNVTQANLDAMRLAAENNLQAVKDSMAAAQEALESAQFKTNFFGVSLFETEEIAAAKEKLAELSAALVEAEARLSAIDHTQSNFNAGQEETVTVTGQAAASLDALKKASEGLGEAFNSGGSLAEGLSYLSREMDVLARAQRDLAEIEAGTGIRGTLDEVERLADQMGLAEGAAAELRSMLSGISATDPFADQARALADVVQFIDRATGGAENMNAAAYAVYESLNLALNTAISLSATDYSGAMEPAVSLAKQLAHQFGIAYNYAYSLSTMQVSTKKLSFGASVPDGSAADGLGGGGAALSFNPETFVPVLSMQPVGIPAPTSGSSSKGGGGGGSNSAEKEADRTKEAYDALVASLDPAVAASQQLADAQEKVNAALKIGYIDATQAADALDLAKEAYDKSIAAIDDGTDIWKSFQDAGASAIDRLIDGTGTLKDALLDVIKQMALAIANKQILAQGGTAVTSLGGLVMSTFAGLFDSGGTIGMGQYGIVGEYGPELVRSTGTGAVVTSRVDTARMMRPQGDQTFNIDARGAQQGVGEEIAAALRSVLPNAMAQTREETLTEVRQSLPGWQQQLNIKGGLV
ncbi:phage tail tape measure protein [Salipiger manganoxidans]|uniref:phage tail tape measure protein n=1 Tax=Salipiger marinus TaxID=555512 RepID=UPI001E33B55A|nr:phage tail tape measure protein [Salipiger manganoxidans]MCD1619118.1 phage tail tape measure protein [Salipiger manganoxidans]